MTDQPPPTPPPTAQHPAIAIDLARIQGPYHTTLQHTLDVLAVSILGGPLVAEQEYQSFGLDGLLKLNPASGLQLPLAQAQQEANHWHLRNAFRDAIDATGLFLDSVRDVAAIARAAASGTLTVGTLKEITESNAEAFRKLGIAKKVQTLREDLGLTLDMYQYVFSVNRVRNCLVHRAGFVSRMDVEADGELKLTYRALEFFSPYPDGSGEIILDKPGVAGAPGGAIMMRAVDRERRFKIGERIVLSPEELTQVFAMFIQFSIVTVAELQGLLPVRPTQTPPASPPAHGQGAGE